MDNNNQVGDDAPNDVSRMTYVQAPKNEPLNLNMSEFDQKPPVENSMMDD